MTINPPVSLGLPVYNGINYLAQALASIQQQTFADFELIIGDNASTDGTSDLCADHAARDRRIRHHRHPTNLGAAANFNRTFELAGGRWFKWCAHDDLLAPSISSAASPVLERRPEVVLCQSQVQDIDPDGRRRGIFDPARLPADHPSPSTRVGARFRARYCMEVFGVIRATALRGSGLIADHVGGDRPLLARLAARGRFATIPEPLFLNRDHAQRSNRSGVRPSERLRWYGAAGRRRALPTWVLYAAYLDIVRTELPAGRERLRGYGQLLRSLAARGNLARLALEPAIAIEPRLYDLAEHLRKAIGRSDRETAGRFS